MIQRRQVATILMGAAMLWAMPGFAASNGNSFKARLSVVPIDFAMQATVAGQGAVTATLAGNKLTINGTFEGLRSPASEAHIYRGPKGIPGPAILDLTVAKATSGSITGTLDLTPSQVQDLRNEELYVQINSERAPEGNLRGWILP
jgi:hypothetical protein